jgi:PAS domain S-box-containing protein
MVFVKDADELRFVLFNREGEELLGIPRHHLLGKTDYDFFPAQQADFFTARDREVIVTGARLEIPEEEILSHTRGLRTLRTLKVPVSDEDGRPRYLLGISLDATELKRAEIKRRQAEEALVQRESYFRSLLEYSSDFVLVVDAAGVITYAGPSAERVFGDAADELRGRDFLAAVHPDDLARVRDAFDDALENAFARPTVECRVRDKAGRWRIIESTGRNALDNPAVAGVVLNTRDITDRVELQNRYLQAQRMEAVGNLAGGVAHDFNNLLTVIALNAALLLDELDEADPRRADVLPIVAAAKSAGGLTQQLLAFSRRQVLHPVLIDVATAVRAMEPLVRRVIGEDVVLATVLPDEPHAAEVFCDRGQFDQVILNLSVNARQAMPRGGTLTISVSAHADEVTIEVADTGEGMSEETRARVFEPFFTTKPTGTGLGLATVFGVVTQSQGHITVESEPGAGTVFRISLPRAEEAGAPPEGPGPEAPRARPGETVLVVDDEAQIRAVVRKLLSRLGYAVLEAPNGAEGLDVARGPDRIDLVLTDMVMPHMRGSELAEHIKEVRPGLPVIFMTGYADSEKGIELAPAMRLLTKPFALDPLAHAVRDAIDSRDIPPAAHATGDEPSIRRRLLEN